LHQHVADHGGFDRTGHDRPSGGVRGGLVEVVVAAAAPDDLHAGDRLAGQDLDRSYHRGIAEGQRVQDHLGHRGCRRGRGLAGLAHLLVEGDRHARWAEEPRVIREDQARRSVDRGDRRE